MSKSILSSLKDLQPELQKMGIAHLSVFGSVARGQSSADSDLDVLVELSRPLGLEFLTVKYFLEDRMGRKVDLCTPKNLHPAYREQISQEKIGIF